MPKRSGRDPGARLGARIRSLPVATPPPAHPWLHDQGDAILLLDVIVSPRASRTRILGPHDGRLKIQLAAAPVDGQANEVLIRCLAETLGVARAQVEIVGGATNRRKTVRLRGVGRQTALLRLLPPSSG